MVLAFEKMPSDWKKTVTFEDLYGAFAKGKLLTEDLTSTTFKMKISMISTCKVFLYFSRKNLNTYVCVLYACTCRFIHAFENSGVYLWEEKECQDKGLTRKKISDIGGKGQKSASIQCLTSRM